MALEREREVGTTVKSKSRSYFSEVEGFESGAPAHRAGAQRISGGVYPAKDVIGRALRLGCRRANARILSDSLRGPKTDGLDGGAERI